jgi:hypothetical protein
MISFNGVFVCVCVCIYWRRRMRFASMRPRPNVCGSAHAWVAQEYIEDVRKTTESVQSAVVQACTLVGSLRLSAPVRRRSCAAAWFGERAADRPLPRAARAARGPSASRSTRPSERRAPSCALCGVRPRRMSRNTRHRCTSSATLSAPAGPARPAGDHEPQACAGLARGARRLRRGQARARRVVRRGWAYCPPSGAFASRCGRQGKARQRSIPTLRECRRPGAARLAVRLWPCD